MKRETAAALLWLGLGLLTIVVPRVQAAAPKQQSLDEWRRLTAPSAPAPKVYVRRDNIRFYFPDESGTAAVAFTARFSRVRIPTEGYRVDRALLSLDPTLSPFVGVVRGWREATVIAGEDWRRLATNLMAALTPRTAGHAAYYQGLLAERLLYRDAQGVARATSVDQPPPGIVMDASFSTEETLDRLARLTEEQLAHAHPTNSLFLLLAPNLRRFPQPLLIDLERKRVAWLSPAALADSAERGFSKATTVQGISGLLFASHGWALLKNPVSSAARLADLGLATAVRILRLPLPRGLDHPAVSAQAKGMDLAQWEQWLDEYTGTRRQEGSLQLLLDGERFFPRLQQVFRGATNHIRIETYIFDRDDVAVAVADQLKECSARVEVQVLYDLMGSTGAGLSPPQTPLPEDFVPPSSISSYLRKDSKVKVRPFLNPWFSVDHSKLYLVDGTRAFLGGMNVGREYRYEWHDLMVEVTGPVVTTLEKGFRRHWAHEGWLGDVAYLAASLSQPAEKESSADTEKTSQVRLLPTRTGWKPFSAAVQRSFERAQGYIYVQNPYLFDRRVIGGLVRARQRGVDVRVILPRVNDFKVGGRSNLVIANYLHEHGVRVYFYPGMTHVKALLVDGWACLGSGNLNHLSLRLCQEQNVATSEPVFAAQLKHDLFEADFARCYELTERLAVSWVDFLSDLALEGF